MAEALLITAIVIVLCILFNRLTAQLGIPMLFAFILLGMLFGSDGVFGILFDNYKFAENICSVALIFIMFYGGFGTRWSEAKPIALKAVMLSTIGVALTAVLVGLFCHFVLGIGLLEGLLIGSVISSTDAASVFSILRTKKLGLMENTASMLELESGSNDPFSYMFTIIMLSIIAGSASGVEVAYQVFAQIVYAIIIGIAVAYGAIFVINKFEFVTAGFDSAFVLAVAVLSFALPSVVGGNGYLSAFLTGIIMGNAKIHNKKPLVHFFDGVTGIMQMLIFFLLGLLSSPSMLPAIMITALLIGLFLTFIARPAAVFMILSPVKCSIRQQLLVSFSGLRGAASIVFAIMVITSGISIENDIFHIVFFIVLLSILFQGSLIPYVAKKLNMIDPDADVLKTFNDYREEIDVQFMELNISSDHPWKDKYLRDITIPPDTLMVMLVRQGEIHVPNGSSMLLEGDVAVLSAPAFQQHVTLALLELEILPGSEWNGKSISDYSKDPNQLVLMIKREGIKIIPHGDTLIKERDILVMNCRN